MLEFGVASKDVRKIWSGDDSAPNSGDAVTLVNNDDVFALPLTKVFGGSGPICTYTMRELQFVIKLPTSEEIMVAQTGEAKGTYKLTNINLEFETVQGDEISRETFNLYRRGRNLYFDYHKWLLPTTWAKDSTIEEVKVNIPLRRIRALVLLFKEKGKDNTEEFANPNIENAKVSIQGVPYQVYNNYGIVKVTFTKLSGSLEIKSILKRMSTK